MQSGDLLNRSSISNLFARDAIGALLVQGAGAMLILLSEIVLARVMGVSQFGLYATVTAWMFVFVLIATLGFNHALLRYVPTYIARESWGALRGVLQRTNAWSLLAALLLAAVVGSVVWLFQAQWGSAVAIAFTVAIVGLPLQVLGGLRQATLRGLQQIIRALSPELIIRPLLLLALLGGLFLLSSTGVDAATALALNVVAILAAFLIGVFWQRRFMPSEVSSNRPLYLDREWIGVAWPLFILVALQAVDGGRIDIMLLGMMVDTESAGIYAAANRLAEIVLFIIASANAAAASMMVRMYATGDNAGLQKLVTMATGGVLLLALPVTVVLILFGQEVLGFFGAEFSEGYMPLMGLLAAQMVVAMAGSVMLLLTLTGYQMEAARYMAIGVTVKLLLALLLIPAFGMAGAAFATLSGAVIWNLLMLACVKRVIGVDPSVVRLFNLIVRRGSVEP
ncbi:Membrane protein involved in the export of O-antigen and teichoic acid [Mariprofundus ferrinatatus]|uniref:Membrane protein involved in the export of O-antigen and teichoic acid n=1 Tax=Mariprofundus ferrinatatus TaxID=1921087 RepID=A0A2K8L5A9_9PROT|nr:oligosaccharide flippase family protein [Mariprofundus ferrinatatus]ATX81429.1 Membrane protein involved in the export of O-antigen and teichoic acid [Mariprofundus ferrinatatus]